MLFCYFKTKKKNDRVCDKTASCHVVVHGVVILEHEKINKYHHIVASLTFVRYQ